MRRPWCMLPLVGLEVPSSSPQLIREASLTLRPLEADEDVSLVLRSYNTPFAVWVIYISLSMIRDVSREVSDIKVVDCEFFFHLPNLPWPQISLQILRWHSKKFSVFIFHLNRLVHVHRNNKINISATSVLDKMATFKVVGICS